MTSDRSPAAPPGRRSRPPARERPLVGLALLLAALAALVLAGAAGASEQRPTAAELESELVCPVCETTLDTSNAPVALRMKAFIRERIAAGDTKSEIKAALVDQFGPSVLAVPPKRGFELIAWLLPIAGLALGAVVVGLLAWQWSNRRSGPPDGDAPLDPALERQLDDELARYEP